MRITLEYYDDPNGFDEPIKVKSNMWIMRVNGHQFPSEHRSLMTLETARAVSECLIKGQEIAIDNEGNL